MPLSAPQPDHAAPVIQEFLEWVPKNCVNGTSGSSTIPNRPFMPLPDLEAHLKAESRITKILRALFESDYQVDVEFLESRYIKVFTILTLIRKGRYIEYVVQLPNLRDTQLPFLEKPAHFPIDPNDNTFWDSFYEKQFLFCPHYFRLNENSKLEDPCILPIISKEALAQGGSAAIYKIKLHPYYDRLNPSADVSKPYAARSANTYVLKTYKTKDAHTYFHNEVDAFKKLDKDFEGEIDPNLIQFLGSYRQGDTYNILLEYADCGTLEDFFWTVTPPSLSEDIVMFWERLFNVIQALVCIHQTERPDGFHGPDILIGWHQDVKPSNILVLSGKTSHPYDVEFKLADLGLSHFKRTVKLDRSIADSDIGGNRDYGAPECHRSDEFLEQTKLNVKPSTDIWSFGAVCSEAAVWVVLGRSGLADYRDQRKRKTYEKGTLQDGSCFHDGEKILKTVDDMHNRLLRGDKVRSEDHVTIPVLDNLVTFMLEEKPEGRLDAVQLWIRSQKILGKVKLELQESNRQRPHLSYEEAKEIRESRSALPRHVLDLLNNFKGRDHVFLMDDSLSMKTHWNDVISLFYVFGYLVKKFDANGLEMYFTVSEKKKTFKNTTPAVSLLKTIKHTTYSNIDLRLEYILRKYQTDLENQQRRKAEAKVVKREFTLVNRARPKVVKPLSLYVFTDAVWHHGDAIAPIEAMIEKQQQLTLPREQVAIEFIRFGNDPTGIGNLEYLDSGLRKKYTKTWDIVDTEPFQNGNLLKMILGATPNWFDDDMLENQDNEGQIKQLTPPLRSDLMRKPMRIPNAKGRKSSQNDSDGENVVDGLKSNLARNQNILKAGKMATTEHETRRRNAEINSRRLPLRVIHNERVTMRNEIYRNSLHAVRSDLRLEEHLNIDGDLGEQVPKKLKLLKTLRENNVIPISSQSSETIEILFFEAESPRFPIENHQLDEPDSDLLSPWLHARSYLCWSLGIMVYRNCWRLQSVHLANDFLSVLVPTSSWSHQGPCVVELKRIQIKEIGDLLKSLVKCIRNIDDLRSYNHIRKRHIGPLVDCLFDVQAKSENLLASMNMADDQENISATSLKREFREFQYLRQSNDFLSIFIKCQFTFQALDLILLAYEGAHVLDFDNVPRSLNEQIDLFDKDFLSSRKVHDRYTSCLRRLPMKCLAPLLGNRDVWVFGHATLHAPLALYLRTDIEIFADVWGPVWKVKDQHEPNKIARYNVGEGSIIPWPFDPVLHPALATGERLCHWISNFVFIKNEPSATDTDSSSSNGEAAKAPIESTISGKFDGSEILVIGAEAGLRLQWEPCHCSIDDLKQKLKEAGRLNHMLASKSYPYIDSQQNSLVVGSHGVQAGRSKIFKDMKEEPLKKGLLAMWENEPGLREPREFENFWGVAVSLCTMNARRVRLVELLGENSVTCLLKRFQWSDLDADGNSHRRRSFFKAVRSVDPCALGDLWDNNPSWREELGKALLICLRILSKTGYDDNRNEFYLLWLPSGCRGPRRVTLRPTDRRWITFLKDTTCSMTAAVVVEDSLGNIHPCRRNRPGWFEEPSILETALCINRTLDPASRLKRARGCPEEAHWILRTDAQTWKHVWDVSRLARGERLWVGSESRLKVLRSLSDWHLLLEVDIVIRALLREIIGIRPSERVGHWEYTDEEGEPIDTQPIPVHIIS